MNHISPAWVPQTTYETAPKDSLPIWDQQVNDHGRMTNMKKTLAHSPLALKVYMEWYPMYDKIVEFVGERAAIIFSHAISSQTDCLICGTFFRRILINWGENPDELVLNEEEQLLVDYGRALSRNNAFVGPEIMQLLRDRYNDQQLVDLTAFAGIMVATNMFNNALGVSLDEYLFEFT